MVLCASQPDASLTTVHTTTTITTPKHPTQTPEYKYSRQISNTFTNKLPKVTQPRTHHMTEAFCRAAAQWTYGLTSTPHRYTKLEGSDETDQHHHGYIKRGCVSITEEDPLLVTAAAAAAGQKGGGGGGSGGGGRDRAPAVQWLGILALFAISAVASVKTMIGSSTKSSSSSEDRATQAQSTFTDGSSFFGQFEVLSECCKEKNGNLTTILVLLLYVVLAQH